MVQQPGGAIFKECGHLLHLAAFHSFFWSGSGATVLWALRALRTSPHPLFKWRHGPSGPAPHPHQPPLLPAAVTATQLINRPISHSSARAMYAFQRQQLPATVPAAQLIWGQTISQCHPSQLIGSLAQPPPWPPTFNEPAAQLPADREPSAAIRRLAPPTHSSLAAKI